MAETLRAFIAVTPPPALQQALEEVRAAFAWQASGWRWVAPENVHLTLKFLGNVAKAQLPAVMQAMQRAAAGQAPFTLCARALGCFPSAAAPRVLWVGLEDPQQRLLALLRRLEAELVALGFAAETRPFRPHLTLARIQRVTDRARWLAAVQAFRERKFGAFPVEALHLFQSHLHPQGARYTVVHTVALPPAAAAGPRSAAG
ncbi:MAG: RNA 2',3'-cyclic phosphodiesterase [Candidatus Tectimicrobiota bacterium]|nr:MAG: RNA 2',3'-cyclic phosphodiesterase [Candidatus Tectomicrobia bacterium]